MTTRAELRAEKPRRPLLRSFRFWVPMGILLLLLVIALVGVLIGKPIYDRAMSARASLVQAMPLATTAKNQILSGDSEGAKATAAQLASLTADAREQTNDGTWKSLEWVPFVGPNLHAVRTAAAVTDDLVTGAVTPATALSLKALTPVDGAINLEAIAGMQSTVAQASDTVDKAATDLESIDHDALIPQVEGALTQLVGAVDELQPLLGPAKDILGVLPAALGADGPRNYLTIFQNNAESRGTGGNPAAIVMITADKGKISIGRQVASTDFNNARPEPIIPLDPETEALYGTKIGRWISDATLTPEFPETATLVQAWWKELVGTRVDAVISFDPVALSYLLEATGPATVPAEPVEVDGYEVQILDKPLVLTADNAVPFLLNQVYWDYEPYAQDAIFAASARSVFDLLTAGSAQPKPLVDSLMRAIDEGRLMYAPATREEAALVQGSKLAGQLPRSNDEVTTMGAYVNDFTQSKLDYYANLSLKATAAPCSKDESATFSLRATFENTVTEELAPQLPRWIAPANFFAKGVIATNFVFYGPVGAEVQRVTVDGKRVDAKVVTHLGRPAVTVPIKNKPSQSHTVQVDFDGDSGNYGPLEVRHTPMVKPTDVDTEIADCE